MVTGATHPWIVQGQTSHASADRNPQRERESFVYLELRFGTSVYLQTPTEQFKTTHTPHTTNTLQQQTIHCTVSYTQCLDGRQIWQILWVFSMDQYHTPATSGHQLESDSLAKQRLTTHKAVRVARIKAWNDSRVSVCTFPAKFYRIDCFLFII